MTCLHSVQYAEQTSLPTLPTGPDLVENSSSLPKIPTFFSPFPTFPISRISRLLDSSTAPIFLSPHLLPTPTCPRSRAYRSPPSLTSFPRSIPPLSSVRPFRPESRVSVIPASRHLSLRPSTPPATLIHPFRPCSITPPRFPCFLYLDPLLSGRLLLTIDPALYAVSAAFQTALTTLPFPLLYPLFRFSLLLIGGYSLSAVSFSNRISTCL